MRSATRALQHADLIRGVSSSAVRYFLGVAQAGSFRRAADLLHVSGSAIHRQIILLEQELGEELFERSRGRNQLKVTPAGAILLAHAREASGAFERALSEIKALKGLRIGTISLGAPEMFIYDFLPDCLMAFHKTHPGITFNILIDGAKELTEQLIRDEIDVAFIFNPPVRSSIQIGAQIRRPLCAVVSKDHPLAKRSSIQLPDCAQYPLLMPANGMSSRSTFDELFGKAAIEPDWIITTTSYEMLRSAARAGLGVAIITDYLVPRNRTDDVSVIPLRDCPPSVFACCTHAGRKLSVAASTFLEHSCKSFAAFDSRRGSR